jgi:hypothetical protein
MHEALSKAIFEKDVGRIDPRLLQHRNWRIISSAFPIFDVIFGHPRAAPLRIRLDCPDWDDLPPSVSLLSEDGTKLTAAPPNIGNVFNGGPHPATGAAFVCMRGAREYHIHSSHVNDLWDNYRRRPGMDLLGLLDQLWHAWKGAVG